MLLHHLLRSGGATARGVCCIAGPTFAPMIPRLEGQRQRLLCMLITGYVGLSSSFVRWPWMHSLGPAHMSYPGGLTSSAITRSSWLYCSLHILDSVRACLARAGTVRMAAKPRRRTRFRLGCPTLPPRHRRPEAHQQQASSRRRAVRPARALRGSAGPNSR